MTSPAASDIQDSVDHLFRHRAGQMTAVLVRIFGIGKLNQIEDAVQEAMLRALRRWSYQGMPDNPTAWMIQVARNYLVDQIRRDRHVSPGEDGLEATIEAASLDTASDPTLFAAEVRDDQLRMIFTCCHPSISPDSQVALALRTIGGFSVSEIARAFLSQEAAVNKLLVRAKQRLREEPVRFEVPAPEELPIRLDAVLKVLYLMFNEGYSALEGEDLVRTDLCFEAIRLSEMMAAHPVTGCPKVDALTALLLFQAARLSTRADAAGSLLLLAEQDRENWNPRLLRRGLEFFRRSACGNELSDYHLEAEIAACHALSPSYDATDWPRVLDCYDALLKRNPSPVIELNRIVALSKVDGPAAGLAALELLRSQRLMQGYYPFYAVSGELLNEMGKTEEAMACYQQAYELTSNQSVRAYLQKRISRGGAGSQPAP